jgi:uncharacterized protein
MVVVMSDQENEDLYPCIGVCMADPASGLCQGCGRPLAESESPEPEALKENQLPETGAQ